MREREREGGDGVTEKGWGQKDIHKDKDRVRGKDTDKKKDREKR